MPPPQPSMSLPDQIAQVSIDLYQNLPSHGKPLKRNNGVVEWTILATICIVLPEPRPSPESPTLSSSIEKAEGGQARKQTDSRSKSSLAKNTDHTNSHREIVPISLGTGSKVLPYSKLPRRGDTLHDSHAEILARRGYLRWLIHQAGLLAKLEKRAADVDVRPDSGSELGYGPDNDVERAEDKVDSRLNAEDVYVERKEDGSFGLKYGVETWLYVSMLPCGDASTLYTAAHQPPSEASQWDDTGANAAAGEQSTSAPNKTPPAGFDIKTNTESIFEVNPKDGPLSNRGNETSASTSSVGTPTSTSAGVARGRKGYSALSTLRTKPGRPDSIPSISMSCSDKIASWTLLGVQGGLLAIIYGPVYLDGIVVGGVELPPPSSSGKHPSSSPCVSSEDAVDDTNTQSVVSPFRGIKQADDKAAEQAWKGKIKSEVERALCGRLDCLKDRPLPPPYALHRPSIHITFVVFPHSKSAISAALARAKGTSPNSNGASDPATEQAVAPSPLSLSCLPFLLANHARSQPLCQASLTAKSEIKPKSKTKAEIISDGSILGFPYKASASAVGPIRERGRSRLCKLEIMRAYLDLMSALAGNGYGAGGERVDGVTAGNEDGKGTTNDNLSGKREISERGETSAESKTTTSTTTIWTTTTISIPPPRAFSSTPTASATAMTATTYHSLKQGTSSYFTLGSEHQSEPGSNYQKAKSILRGFAAPITRSQYMKGLEDFDGLLATIATDPTPARSAMATTRAAIGDSAGECHQDEGRHDIEDCTPPCLAPPPFRGWLVSGRKFELFDQNGQIIESSH